MWWLTYTAEINSERDDSKADAGITLDSPVKALEKFLEIAKRDGYETKNVDNYAGHLQLVGGKNGLCPYGRHCLQVLVGRRIPYRKKLSMVSSYARGSSDKGPTACYYGFEDH